MCYDRPNKTTRTTSLGYGKRFGHFISTSDAPSPEKYSINLNKLTPSFTFGTGRDKFAKVYLRENPPTDPSAPGPSHYSVNRSCIEGSGFTMKPRNNHG